MVSGRLVSRFRTGHSQRRLKLLASFFSTTSNPVQNASSGGPDPPPIRASLTESAGRAVFATRRIRCGELIHTAKPIVAHPSLCNIHGVCYFCLGNGKIVNSVDSEAQCASFCSEECVQLSKVFYDVETRADWSTYDNYCRTRGLKYPLLVKRLACMVISGAISANHLDILQPSILYPEILSVMEEGYNLLRSTFTKADIYHEQISFLTKEWYSGILARIRINAFRVELAGGSSYEDLLALAAASVESEAAVGNAVYMLPSFYNHDCDPNTHIVWINNVNARLKTLRDVEADEELRICYIDASMSRDARQSLLYQGFGFHCNCLRCISGD